MTTVMQEKTDLGRKESGLVCHYKWITLFVSNPMLLES